MLQKSAYTGIAASLIDGKTTHNSSNDISMEGQVSTESKGKRQAHWKHSQMGCTILKNS